jgi:small subunit ribosomal protein S6
MRDYEAMVVIQPDLDDDGVTALLSQVGDVVRRAGGEVAATTQLVDKKGNVSEVTEGWTKRRLAYSLKGRREGYYAVLRLQLPPEGVSPVEAYLRITEDVLRYLVVRGAESAAEA